MSYSRAGTPIPASKPGVDKRIDDKMEGLLQRQLDLEGGIAHYKDKIRLNDWWKDWYENALKSYEKRLEDVMREMKNCSGYKEDVITKGPEAAPEVDARRTGPPSVKEKGHKQ